MAVLSEIRGLAGIAVTTLLIAAGAQAQQAGSTQQTSVAQPSGDEQLETIIVTAQKREQNLQNVGISITALTGDDIAKLGLVSTTDLVQQIPALQFQQVGSFYTVFDLRGVSQNDFAPYEEAPVAVYEDGAYRAVLGELAGALYDLKAVEVDRGPQGTLFGRNATGGLIQYTSNKPTDSFESYASFTAGNFGEIDSQGAVSGPLTSWLDARFAFATNYNTGYVRDLSGGPDLGNQNLYQGRLQFLFKPNDDLKVLVKLHGLYNPNLNGTAYSLQNSYPNSVTGLGSVVPSNVNFWGPYFANASAAAGVPGIWANFPSCPGCGPAGLRTPSNPYSYDLNGYPESFYRLLYGSTVTVSWNMGHGIDFTSVTDFLHFDESYTDNEGAGLLGFNYWQSFHQFSEELRVNGSNGPFKWTAGLYFLDMNASDYNNNIFNAVSAFGTSTLGVGLLGNPGNVYDVRTYSEAAFGQAEWAFTDQLTAIVGIRESRDEKINSYALYNGGGLLYGGTPWSLTGTPDFVVNRSTTPLAEIVNTLPSWKFELDYKPTDNALFYTSVSRGIKSGGFNEFAVTSLPVPPGSLDFRPERLTDFELGEKYTFWGGKARLNAGLFYYDYRNYQSFALVNGTTSAVQNYDARDKGGELELSLLPVSGLELGVGVSGLDTYVENVVLSTGVIAPRRVMPLAPKWSINSLARYTWHAWDSTWWLQADAKWSTYQYFETYNAPTDYQPAYMLANVSLGYKAPSEHFDFRLYCKNITDKLYQQFNEDSSSLGYGNQIYGMPRTYGGTLTYHF
jgi:iron complex outermembrane recepter protein